MVIKNCNEPDNDNKNNTDDDQNNNNNNNSLFHRSYEEELHTPRKSPQQVLDHPAPEEGKRSSQESKAPWKKAPKKLMA